jgi:integrase/recombinase XerD
MEEGWGVEMELEGFKRYLVTEIQLSELSITRYLGCLREFILWCISKNGTHYLETQEEVEKFLSQKLSETSHATLKPVISTLKHFYEMLWSEKKVPHNLGEFLEIPRVVHRYPEILSISEIAHLMKINLGNDPLGIRNKALMEVLYSSGARINEALNLTIHSHIEGSGFLRLMGKGQRERLVPIGGHAISSLSKYLKESRPSLLGKKNSEMLFCKGRSNSEAGGGRKP